MDAKSILDNLLNSSQRAAQSGTQIAQQASAKLTSGTDQGAMLKGAGAGAAAAGAVALLFGSKGTRKFAKKALTLGGTAALGGLAYKTFSDWQAQAKPDEQVNIGTPIAALSHQQATARSEAIVQAMISAARVDGHIDELEQARITEQISAMGLEKDVTQFLLAEMNNPVDAARIAALADSPEAAAEMYLVSAVFVDNNEPHERSYLDQLASLMGLNPDMVKQLEMQLDGNHAVA